MSLSSQIPEIKGKYSQIPLVNALLVPISQTERNLLSSPFLLLVLHLLDKQTHFLTKLPQRSEPVVTAVLVAIADEKFVEERVDVLELSLVFVGGVEYFFGGEVRS